MLACKITLGWFETTWMHEMREVENLEGHLKVKARPDATGLDLYFLLNPTRLNQSELRKVNFLARSKHNSPRREECGLNFSNCGI